MSYLIPVHDGLYTMNANVKADTQKKSTHLV